MYPPASKWSPVNPRPYSHYASKLYSRTEFTTNFSRFNFDTSKRFVAFEVYTKWRKVSWIEEETGQKKRIYEPEDYGVKYLNKGACVTSEEVFKNPKILPFSSGISLDDLQKDRRFDDLCAVHHDSFAERRMYRINDTTACDNYGRVFILNRAGFWVWKPLNLGDDNRGITTIGGISKPSYYWPGIAGYDPQVQTIIFDTPSIEIHHTTENTLVFAPSRLAPMPAALHRDYVHYSSRYQFFARFFEYQRDNPWREWRRTINLYPRINKR